jgi:hypothetical protein
MQSLIQRAGGDGRMATCNFRLSWNVVMNCVLGSRIVQSDHINVIGLSFCA